MPSFGLNHLMNPLVGGDLLSAILPLFWERQDQRRLQNDPNILNYINGRIGEYNASNAYNPETGQFNAGSPFGDAASGHGGAYGRDTSGNPLSPFQANTQYHLSQLAGSQGGLDAGLGNLGRVAEQAGVAAPSGFNLNVPQGLDPSAVQGVDQSVRTPPQPMQALSPRQDWWSNFIGSFETGINSVPREGFAYLHPGEAVIPAAQNPMAGQAPQPMAAGGGAPANAGGPPALPANGGMLPPPQMTAAPQIQAPQYVPMTPGLNQGVQNQIVQRGREGIDREYEGMLRQMRNAAPAGGGGGAMERRMFDAEIARRGEMSGLQRDVGIEAANRQFTDTLAMNEQLFNRFMGEGNMANTGRGLDIQERLGLGNIDTERRGQDIQEALGRLGLGNDARGLDIQERQGQDEIALRRMLGLEGENTARRGQDIQDALGRLGLGNDARGLDIQERQGQDEIALRRMLGLESENTARRGQDIQQGLGQDEMALRRMLGLEGEETTRRGQTMQDAVARLGLQNDARGLGIQERLGLGSLQNDARGLNIQEALGRMGLSNDRYGLETTRNLGQGQLDFTNRSFNADFSRGLANDAFGQYQYGQNRNDALAQQDFQNQLQQWGLGQNQNQFADLMALLGQGYGTPTGGGGGTGGTGGTGTGGTGNGGGGQGFAPFNGFFQNMFNRN